MLTAQSARTRTENTIRMQTPFETLDKAEKLSDLIEQAIKLGEFQITVDSIENDVKNFLYSMGYEISVCRYYNKEISDYVYKTIISWK